MGRKKTPSKIEYPDDKTIVIKLNGEKGGDAIASIEDYEKIKDKTWNLNSHGYAVWAPWDGPGRSMHQIVAGVFHRKSGLVVDHINHITTDNRRDNLRVVTRSFNTFHRKKADKYTGVNFDSRSGKYVAQIMVNKKNNYLGLFENREDAVKARAEAEVVFFGSKGWWRK